MNQETNLFGRGNPQVSKKTSKKNSDSSQGFSSPVDAPMEFFFQPQRTSNAANQFAQNSSTEEEREDEDELVEQMVSLQNLLQRKHEESQKLSKKAEKMEEQLAMMNNALLEKKRLILEQIQKHKKLLAELEESEQEAEDWELPQMIELSQKARLKAHVPYSNFHVGCVLKTTSGMYYTGCNVENASYGLAICAERTAIVKAVSEGHRTFERIVISSDLKDVYITPCGACRQFMAEFGDFDVFLTRADQTYKRLKVSELLPHSFSNSDLNAARYE